MVLRHHCCSCKVYSLQHLSAWYLGSIVLYQEVVCLDEGWCGVGPESEKNELAKSTLKRLMKHAIWMNIHLAPFPTFEIRVSDGYGARWVADGSQVPFVLLSALS